MTDVHTEKIITINDDFTDRLTDVGALLRNEEPFALLIQEGKRTWYRRVVRRLRSRAKRDDSLPLVAYRIAQIMHDEATRGLAIIWREEAPRVHRPQFRVLVEPHGAVMNSRGVLWVVVRHPMWGRVVLATAHRPPWRYRHLWPEFDLALANWVDEQDHPILLGMDTNTPLLVAFARRVGLIVAGKGIDAVLARAFRLSRPRRLKRRNSDHRPVAVDATR